MTFQQILQHYRQISSSERDKGARFERLMQAYLLTDPKYAYQLKKVWLWSEFPGKNDLGFTDTGIDLVALTQEGDYWAIQCKCFQADAIIDKPAVDSFLATSSREFKNEQLQNTRFAHRLWISTTNKWGPNAEEAIRNQNPAVSRINLAQLLDAPVDWQKLEQGIHGETSRLPKKSLRKHQTEARDKTHAYFQTAERGKLIMACGTGKTFTALRIAENETGGKGLVLFLVPSIALLGQSLREWTSDANEPINAICICSDPEISKKKTKNEDADTSSTIDLALPASTNVENILHQFRQLKQKATAGMTVVFSTYQSIEVIAKAQKVLLENGFAPFDLIICDEAHRTTGVTLANDDESAFTKVHDNGFIQAKKRLYMTATPRLYSDDLKSKAAQADAVLCSMDDTSLYGEEIYRIGFGEAVESDLLTDYKVLILTLNDQDVPPAVQRMISNQDTEINSNDVSKIIGTINALSKQFLGDQGITKEADPEPMRRAVAFCQNIDSSKKITANYNLASEAYLNTLPAEKKQQMVNTKAEHIDGTMSATTRDELLGWLKADTEGNECRILTNVRCLSEGVDVPSLDAVLFLSARNSQVDVVQSVGRVMRKSPGKKYGYIIIPVVVPSDVEPDKALDDNERYKVVWTVLNALRAHDDRFNAIVNKIELNQKKPDNILVGRPEHTYDTNGDYQQLKEERQAWSSKNTLAQQLSLQFEQLQHLIFARMVQKVGDRRYWEQWAKDVAIIAEQQIERIGNLIRNKADQRRAFEQFLQGLQKNINPSINEAQAVEMLAQHIITQPVFEALFEGYSFAKSNPVSMAMQNMLATLDAGNNLAAQDPTLQKFYDSVRKRAEGIDNAEGKQRIIIELYDKFFKAAFPKMVEQLGIVYTPVEVVDFIIRSVADVLQQEFGRSIADENIHILDPFTGTGTFMTRLLQSGLIGPADLARKYHHELHANEIVLLAYYIAAINIENAYHDLRDKNSAYEPFEGIVLTDTFQLGETDESQKLFTDLFPQNSERVVKQKKAPLRIIIGNPPYSVGQKSANDNAQNLKYERLDQRIADTYARTTQATNKNSLYDSYIKAFRWSTDRLDPTQGGIIAFVSNGAWLDSNSTDGLRKTLEKEFSSIWVFNLRGNQRTSGELSRKEGGKIFGSGSRTPIAITLLVKNPAARTEKAKIHYHDIGDYLSREEKLARIRDWGSMANAQMPWQNLEANEYGDWISQRNDVFGEFVALGDKEDKSSATFFNPFYSRGIATARDAYCYNFSKLKLEATIHEFIDYYELQRVNFQTALQQNNNLKLENFIDFDTIKVTWNRGLKNDMSRSKKIYFKQESVLVGLYRPFSRQNVYFAQELNDMVYQIPKLFPNPQCKNLVISVAGVGGSKEFTAIITDLIPDVQLEFNGQCFPLYYYEEQQKQSPSLFDAVSEEQYVRRDGISDFILGRAQQQYGKNVSKEDIFYYVYGFLHSPEYRQTFANDLKKMLPRLPLVDEVRDFWAFSKAGRALADLHLHYENVPPHPAVQVAGAESGDFRVEKMRFPQKGQKDTIVYNHKISLSNIPARAYEYVVNGKPAIEWIMERYQVTVHKESGIQNDPNDWAAEVGQPRYILDLLLSVINLSVQTVEIVEKLPRLSFGEANAPGAELTAHSLVRLKNPIGNLKAGTQGAVVYVYQAGAAYEVEFMVNGQSVVETVEVGQIEKVS